MNVDALRPSTPIGEGDHAAGTPRVPTASRPETADDLRDAILQLYRQLASADAVGTGGRRAGNCLAYHAIEAQIRTLADRHTALTGWTAVR
jgi:hypothetical protein